MQAGHECRCLLRDERYLGARPRAPTRPRSTDELKGLAGDPDQDRLLHVLVTRPALATRPRDNIVLEGDMDLRTTFETTYEQLARMRLEHWKRCQKEANAGDADHEADRERAQVSFVASDYDDDDDDDDESHHQDLTAEGPAELGDSSAPDGNKTPPPPPPTTTRANAEPASNFIDPDLSSIIVYDANLDRLQRVGLRKRSKYRPSTSLRPGGLGLFGDAQPPAPAPPAPATASDHHHQQQQQQQQQQQRAPAQAQAQEEPTRRRTPGELAMDARNLMHSSQSNRLVYSSLNLPIDSKRKCRDNVNMIDHIKEQNIVEKRSQPPAAAAPQVNGQVGQTKVSGVISDEKLAADRPPNDLADDLAATAAAAAADDDETNMRLLAQQEEAEVVEEIQRLTRGLPEQEQVANTGNGASQSRGGATSYVRDAESRADDDLRRSRLYRTCQNQNFDIYNNDYRRTLADQDQSSSVLVMEEQRRLGTRASPVANNLFRESPDFIMTTTGRYLDEFAANKLAGSSLSGNIYNVYEGEARRESAIEVGQLIQAQPEEASVGVAEATNEVSRTPCDQCRVLRLGDEFHYVGSKLGHNYFVEHSQQ